MTTALVCCLVQEQQRVCAQHADERAAAAGGEVREVAVARAVGTVLGRVTAAHEAAQSWSAQVGSARRTSWLPCVLDCPARDMCCLW